MKKNNSFFENGVLTSSAAGHVRNVATEQIQSLQNSLENINFVKSSVQLLAGEVTVLSEAQPVSDFDNITELLNRISKLTGLVAWLNEAIRHKDELISYISKNYSLVDYCKDRDIKRNYGVEQTVITTDDYLTTCSADTLASHFILQAKAATYGKLITPAIGSLHKARHNALKRISNPNQLSGEGRDTIITRYEVPSGIEPIDALFNNVQGSHREAQAAFNKLQFKIRNLTLEANRQSHADYLAEFRESEAAEALLMTKYNQYIADEISQLSDLKIAIPDALQDIYKQITTKTDK